MHSIGQRIKELRRKNDLTQEKLADFLCVSCQAVSKWECGVSSPDLALIGPLTQLLHVSADELLGLTKPIMDERHAELTADCEATWKTGDLEERYRILQTAVAEYPGDMEFLKDFAWATAMRSFSFEDDETYRAAQEEGIRLFARVIENCEDLNIRCSAIVGIVQYLGFRKRYDEARQYAELYPDDLPRDKDDILKYCLTGEERAAHKHKLIRQALGVLVCRLDAQSIENCHAAINLIKLFHPDGRYLDYHETLAYIKRQLAMHYTRQEDFDQAMQYLQEAKEHACAAEELNSNPQVYHFASPFFHLDTFNPGDFLHTGNPSVLNAFYKALESKVFDPLRGRADFRVLGKEQESQA